ncbi:hypothetical protein GCM10007989_07350 [Devosia pacifica]|uniref:Uncharacterized protein n=1 Tax=Devosia pacifica TaxID=1335967 RepID=A0A918RXR0_9HYPH|nr:N-acetyltransferase [Devosia pacifica]GHA15126.1 hypothetical protein GCM10007989_07350 [Devosia pacifica]
MNILPPEAAQEVEKDLAAWCARQIGYSRVWGHCRALGVFDDEKLVAAAIYHNWQPEAGVIEISTAAITPRWLTRKVLHELFAYPFDRLGYQLVVLRISANRGEDRGICRMCRAFGFEEYRIPRLRGRDEDELIFTLTDDAWRASRFEKVR